MSRFIHTAKVFVLALVLVAAGRARADGPKPNLYLVSIGVSKFEYKAFERGVKYAAKDARDVAELFKKQEGKQFGKVECRLLTDTEATRDNVAKALAWLAETATTDSVVVVFLAGHGGPNPLGKYEFLPHDAHPVLPSTNVSGQMLRDGLQDIAGERLLLLDTCFAGGFAGKGTDFITLASCSAKQTSGEMISKQNGYFTSVLVEGLSGKADQNKDGVVTLSEATGYLRANLGPLTGGKQLVMMHRPANLQVSLPLAQTAIAPSIASSGVEP